jgi:hypothetical protein
MLPFYALVCVGAGAAWPLVSSRFRWVIIGLLAWQAVVTVIAYPLYLQFISEAAGGAQNGYRCLYDSNYDWGQDANRLKRFLDEQGIPHIYLDYFGTQFNIDYLKIKNTRVTAQTAQQLHDGYLVVSASELVQPDWAWLRKSRQSWARVAYTLFVYRLD